MRVEHAGYRTSNLSKAKAEKNEVPPHAKIKRRLSVLQRGPFWVTRMAVVSTLLVLTGKNVMNEFNNKQLVLVR